MRFYAIGDIHGQRGMLEAAHERIARDRDTTGDREAPVIHLGDLVDRGPDSSGVIQFLVEGRERGEPWLSIRGNHDAMFADFLSTTANPDDQLRAGLTWLNGRVGGEATLASYGIRTGIFRSRRAIVEDAREAVPASHVDFLNALPLFHATPELLFVHAGIRPGIPITRQDPTDLTWIREDFLGDERDHGYLVVHGHTPVDEPQHRGNRINLDTGAGFGHPMTAAVFEDRACWILTDDGRQPLNPPD
jgi:serine/threonine protein phosphatase 1